MCVDMGKMDSIVEVHQNDFYTSVQPGVTRMTLNNYLRDTGLMFPIGEHQILLSFFLIFYYVLLAGVRVAYVPRLISILVHLPPALPPLTVFMKFTESTSL